MHYDGKEKYSKLKDVSEQNESRIREAKAKQETFSDENRHEKQCHLVPDIIDNDIHGIHMEPCYKKFTLILAKKSIEQTIGRSSKRSSMDVTKNVEDSLATAIINLNTIGKELARKFKQEPMLVENNEIGNTGSEKICKNVHGPLPRNKTRTFKNSAKTYVIVKDKVKTTAEINRNILGALLSFSAKANQPIYFDSALSYPLSPIPLSLALPDGARRETPKSKLMEVI